MLTRLIDFENYRIIIRACQASKEAFQLGLTT